MNDVKLVRRGLKSNIVSTDHLKGKLDTESMLEDLGIELAYRLGPNQVMCHCPDLQGNHSNGDANPSFGYNEEKMVYNCFVCGSGNIIELVSMMTGKNDQDSLTFLEEHSNLTPLTSNNLIEKAKGIMHPYVEEEIMPEYPADSLFTFRKIHPYLYERGLTKNVIIKMQVGFDDEHAGIVIPHFFQDKLRGWQIRHLVMENDKYLCDFCERESSISMAKGKVAKYKNTKHFPKKNTLYAYDQTKEEVRQSGDSSVILVESPMAALWLMSHGYPQVMATFGQFSDEQGMLLLPFERIYFWPDNDDAGYNNAFRASKSLMKYSNLFFIPVVPGPKSDAANLHNDQIQDYIDSAYQASLFKLRNKEGKLSEFQPSTNTNIEE